MCIVLADAKNSNNPFLQFYNSITFIAPGKNAKI